jgi:hypothetical protein
LILPAAVLGGPLLAVALALFQPWKLWIDDKVNESAPVGAAPVAVPDASPTTAPAGPSATSVPEPPAATSFRSIDHGTSGRVTVLADGAGRRYLRIEDLDTSNGPDLKVYLSANPPDGPEGAFDDTFADLGRLKGNIGSQNYEIPRGADLSQFRSVVIWCDRFNSAFGAAPLA